MILNVAIGSQIFRGVTVPLLWGTRAILKDFSNRLSVIDLGGSEARPEIVGDEPAPDAEYLPTDHGFRILSGGTAVYEYNPQEKRLTSLSLNLPDCEIKETETRIGSNTFSGNVVIGYPVGIAVSEGGIAMGAPLPPGLAKLVI